jgi:drug/metabolite transporter (DMT)-like permease|tara:strand:+ start:310 stop:1227 length:918 start_codon:yes stop_codon:yes gene_type:complete
MINQTMGSKDWAMLLSLSFLWGGSFFFVGVAVTELPPLTIVTLRVAIAAIILWMILLLSQHRAPKTAKLWRDLFVMGLLNNVIPFSLIVWGQTHIASGLASILNATIPLFTVVIAGWLLPDEQMTARKVSGVAIGFFGVIVLMGPSSLEQVGTDTLAQLAILGAAISYGFATSFGRRFKTLGVSPFQTSVGQVTASTIMLLPLVFFLERPDQIANPSGEVWLAVIGLGAFSTALAYILFFNILSSAGATNVTLVAFLVPLTAILLGWLILDEQLRIEHFAGMVFIGLGLAAIDGRLWNKLKAASQ